MPQQLGISISLCDVFLQATQFPFGTLILDLTPLSSKGHNSHLSTIYSTIALSTNRFDPCGVVIFHIHPDYSPVLHTNIVYYYNLVRILPQRTCNTF